ncbi:putative nuclease HARBI1 isoform X1 [Scylla paramamosain]|uniref:putative nuclease HARBI1 isoform X1 n=2 Tax=Scylla paramamosain TaxID=85552 RepID=UPI00308381A1
MQATQFSGVVGVIDGTHIRIVAPHVDEHVYVNRKRYHNINVQVVFDAHYKILDIVARWPGSVNDARILDESALKLMFEEQHVPAGCYLLRDSGYPCKQWLLTPYLRPQTVAQANYNRVHRKARCTVERGIGQLKKRFHVLLSEVRLGPEKTCKLITVCAVLHNICKARNIPLPDDNVEDDAVEVGDGAQLHLNPGIPAAHNRHPFRDYIANLHFQ